MAEIPHCKPCSSLSREGVAVILLVRIQSLGSRPPPLTKCALTSPRDAVASISRIAANKQATGARLLPDTAIKAGGSAREISPLSQHLSDDDDAGCPRRKRPMLLLFVALVQKKPAIRTQRVRLLPSNSTPPSPPSTSPITIAYPTTPPPSSSSSSQHHKSGADQEGAFNLMALGMMEETVSSPRTARSNPIAHRARVGYGSNSIADILREGCSGSGESPAEMRLCFMQLETALKKGKSMGETRRMLSMWMKSHEPPRGRLRYEGHPGLGSQYPPACEETAARTINLLSKNITNKEWTALGPLERNKTKNASSSTISPGDVKKAVTVCPCGRLLASKDALRQHVIGVHFREECGYKYVFRKRGAGGGVDAFSDDLRCCSFRNPFQNNTWMISAMRHVPRCVARQRHRRLSGGIQREMLERMDQLIVEESSSCVF
eukprot:jgi/Bigna1/72587/fgenesh1_pg.20_\